MSFHRQWYTKRDRVAYHRLMTGVTWHRSRGEKHFRFVTLTGVTGGNGYRRNFDALRRWIRKFIGRFEYFQVRTNEGKYGVIHLLVVGAYLKRSILSGVWSKISGAWNVSVSKTRDFVYQGFELTRQKYTCRYSWSKNWLPRGLIEKWKEYKYKSIPEWNSYVGSYVPEKRIVQKYIS